MVVGLGGVAAGRADPAGHAVVDPADADGHGRADLLAAEDDVHDAAGGELVVEEFDDRLVGAEVDDVVEGLVGEGTGLGGRLAQHLARRALGIAGEPAERDAGGVVGDDQQPAAGLDGLALGADVGVLDAGPRLDQGDGRRAESSSTGIRNRSPAGRR